MPLGISKTTKAYLLAWKYTSSYCMGDVTGATGLCSGGKGGEDNKIVPKCDGTIEKCMDAIEKYCNDRSWYYGFAINTVWMKSNKRAKFFHNGGIAPKNDWNYWMKTRWWTNIQTHWLIWKKQCRTPVDGSAAGWFIHCVHCPEKCTSKTRY